MSRRFSIASVTVAYNAAAVLDRHLESLRNQSRSLDEIIVVNNASTDRTSEILSSHYPHITLLDLSTNGGVAGGLSAGLAYAAIEKKHDWVWLFDQDSVPADDALEQLLAALGALQGIREDVAILAPLCVRADGTVVCPPLSWHGPRLAPKTISDHLNVTFADCVISSGALIRGGAVAEVGLPVADFFMDFVDYEYCLRLRRHGHKIAVVHSSLLRHSLGAPSRFNILGRVKWWTDHAPWREYYMIRNEIHTLWSYYPNWVIKAFTFYRLFRHIAEILLFGSNKLACLRMISRGVRDGLAGRLGIRYSPDDLQPASADSQPAAQPSENALET